MEPLKNIYNQKFIDDFSQVIQKVIPNFNPSLFIKSVFDKGWKQKELKQRMRHITLMLRPQLSNNYKTMINEVLDIVKELEKSNTKGQSFEWMFLPEFMELFGLENYKTSVNAFEIITQFTSCEFAVRPFIKKYPNKMMQQHLLWSKHKNTHVRRLATEGCRPMLPWAMALPELKKEPKPIVPILENLKNDSSKYVRRSVANNLNDIAKNQPETVINIAKKWLGKTPETDKLVKHACRTLLKAGNQEIMSLFGFGSVDKIEINRFKIQELKFKIGGNLNFSFDLKNNSNSNIKIRLEYAIYYQKANGTLSKKVYKISEKTYAKNAISSISKKQSFKVISTRKFHLGLHQVTVVVNGVEFDRFDFWLVD
jgi:3-methyladenine DNA glycosylase AlkC